MDIREAPSGVDTSRSILTSKIRPGIHGTLIHVNVTVYTLKQESLTRYSYPSSVFQGIILTAIALLS